MPRGLVLAVVALVAAVPVPDEELLASLLDGDEQQTAGEWVLADQVQRGQLMNHERAEAVDEMSLLQVGLAAIPRVTQTAWFDMSIGGKAAGRIRLGLFGEATPGLVLTPTLSLAPSPTTQPHPSPLPGDAGDSGQLRRVSQRRQRAQRAAATLQGEPLAPDHARLHAAGWRLHARRRHGRRLSPG